jgi:hypothetical protein
MKHSHGFGSARAYVHAHLDLWDLVEHAFGATGIERHEFGPNPSTSKQIGDSVIVLETGDPPHPERTPGSIYVYVPDADGAYCRALDRGATCVAAPEANLTRNETPECGIHLAIPGGSQRIGADL